MKKFFEKLNIHSQKGVTIIELLIYMGILVVLISVLTSIFISALDVQSESTASSSVEQDGNYILARLAYDIHRAQSISSPALGTTANSFTIIIEGVNYIYSIDMNDNLILTNDLGVNNLNNFDTKISDLTVEHLGNAGGVEDALNISFTLSSRTKKVSGPEVRDYRTNLSLRRQ